jgi:hypothetical protein
MMTPLLTLGFSTLNDFLTESIPKWMKLGLKKSFKRVFHALEIAIKAPFRFSIFKI